MDAIAQRIEIAKACGWIQLEQGYWKDPSGHEWQVMHGWQTYKDGSDILPDYLNDLNAMREAEGMLGDKWMPYARLLLEITTGCGPAMPLGFLNGATLCSAVHATAPQRAEAFLKCLGLWIP